MPDNRQPQIDGDLLKRARIRQGFTLRALSRRCAELGNPVDHKGISAYERGLTRPRPDTLLTLAQALGYPDPAVFLLDAA
jgi:transcriptional regulator with XRE-family HTH domain